MMRVAVITFLFSWSAVEVFAYKNANKNSFREQVNLVSDLKDKAVGAEVEEEQKHNDESPHSFVSETSAVENLLKEQILLKNASPLNDSAGSQRMGKLHMVPIPSPANQQPFTVTHTSVGPFTQLLPKKYGENLITHKMRKQLLDAHNYVRKLESNEATYMTKLIWDFSLEAYALQWTQYLCTASGHRYFEHSPDRKSGTPAWPFRVQTGENLYTTTGLRDAKWDPSEVIYKWYQEKEYYDWNSGKAATGHTGKPVGHYKQLVRQEATAVGCAVFSGCKAHPDWQTFVSCHYDHGNLKKEPYVRRPTSRAGVVCDECPQGYNCCEAGLCDGQFPSNSYNLSPFGVAKDSSSEWHYCKAHNRTPKQCENTAALKHVGAVPGDTYGLEFNTCQCGGGIGYSEFFSTVQTGLFWYRNGCNKVTKEGGYSAIQVQVTSEGRLRGAANNKKVSPAEVSGVAENDLEAEESSFLEANVSSHANSEDEVTDPPMYMDREAHNPLVFLQDASANTVDTQANSRVMIAEGVHVDPPPFSSFRLDLKRLGLKTYSQDVPLVASDEPAPVSEAKAMLHQFEVAPEVEVKVGESQASSLLTTGEMVNGDKVKYTEVKTLEVDSPNIASDVKAKADPLSNSMVSLHDSIAKPDIKTTHSGSSFVSLQDGDAPKSETKIEPPEASGYSITAAAMAARVADESDSERRRVDESSSLVDSKVNDPQAETLKVIAQNQPSFPNVRGMGTTDDGDVEEFV
eukprot:GHVN01019212.1.p1 GENE.GHVN01019212.1~~GHVN01019212.1.p1  ORF type:complete len:742 (+),score=114.14 GHVN01019212.1:3107-5332(+)